MTDWAADSAAQIMARNAQIRGERTVIVDGAQLEADIALRLRIAYAAGIAKAEIEHRKGAA